MLHVSALNYSNRMCSKAHQVLQNFMSASFVRLNLMIKGDDGVDKTGSELMDEMVCWLDGRTFLKL